MTSSATTIHLDRTEPVAHHADRSAWITVGDWPVTFTIFPGNGGSASITDQLCALAKFGEQITKAANRENQLCVWQEIRDDSTIDDPAELHECDECGGLFDSDDSTVTAIWEPETRASHSDGGSPAVQLGMNCPHCEHQIMM